MLEVFAQSAGFRFRNIAVGSCPPLTTDPESFVAAKSLENCRRSLSLVKPLIEKFPVVILSSAWLGYHKVSPLYLDAVFETARGLAEAGKLVIVLGQVPWIANYDPLCREKSLSYPWLSCAADDSTVPLIPPIKEINAKLRRFSETTTNVRYFDANAYLCPGGRCALFTPSGEPRYYDDSHLTLAESTRLGGEIVRREGVPPPFALVSGWAAPTGATNARPSADGDARR